MPGAKKTPFFPYLFGIVLIFSYLLDHRTLVVKPNHSKWSAAVVFLCPSFKAVHQIVAQNQMDILKPSMKDYIYCQVPSIGNCTNSTN